MLKKRIIPISLVLMISLFLSIAVLGCDLVQQITGRVTPPATGAATAVVPTTTAIAKPATAVPTIIVTGAGLPATIAYPTGWTATETAGRIVVARDANALAGGELEGPAVLIRQVEGAATAEALLGQANPPGAEILRQENATFGGKAGRLAEAQMVSPVSGRGYRTLSLAAMHDGKGYLVVASAPLEQWDKAWPELQGIINSVAFK
jgi:hypothetical protein